jgi:predicted nucleic acid-binding protein
VIHAVLDVNVLISAFIGGAEGPPRLLIYAWREGRFSLVVSPALLGELTTVLGRPKFDR